MLLAVIPLAWLSVLTLFAAICRAASYGEPTRAPAGSRREPETQSLRPRVATFSKS